MKNLIERPQDNSFSEFKRFLNEGLGEENFEIEYGDNDEILIRTKIGHDLCGLYLIDETESEKADDMDNYTEAMDKLDRGKT